MERTLNHFSHLRQALKYHPHCYGATLRTVLLDPDTSREHTRVLNLHEVFVGRRKDFRDHE